MGVGLLTQNFYSLIKQIIPKITFLARQLASKIKQGTQF